MMTPDQRSILDHLRTLKPRYSYRRMGLALGFPPMTVYRWLRRDRIHPNAAELVRQRLPRLLELSTTNSPQ